MDYSLIFENLLSPPILFFIAGMLAVAVKSDLEIPQPVSRFLSLFLLFAIGIKGGHELAISDQSVDLWRPLGLAVFFAVTVPLYTYVILKKKMDKYNAGAIAATYGSVSAVTFVTAVAFLQQSGIEFGGQMIAALAIMESPAIVVGVMLIRQGETGKGRNAIRKTLHEAFTNGSVFVLLSSMAVGLLISKPQYGSVEPFTEDLFKGMLSLFMLDMGLMAAKRIGGLRQGGGFLLGFSLIVPLFNALIAMLMCHAFYVEFGDAFLLTILAASASYIAVPAAMRMAVPQANPGIYVPMSLGITFPLNVLLGIPLYYNILKLLYY